MESFDCFLNFNYDRFLSSLSVAFFTI
ncbi:hypothetical protein CY0110_16717 [Crocosphaera chwakensis CCY0110]|uniref:Uncharacterized protein n=1 Tax=Crocosphaera chwakensis CCY0110 TaxID=391612 RepID=A3II25_9CHRO|nr:hypothetical protein CY0110_16717 [Crocosphaera chwakensis CCY0110]